MSQWQRRGQGAHLWLRMSLRVGCGAPGCPPVTFLGLQEQSIFKTGWIGNNRHLSSQAGGQRPQAGLLRGPRSPDSDGASSLGLVWLLGPPALGVFRLWTHAVISTGHYLLSVFLCVLSFLVIRYKQGFLLAQ